ncbi:MAG: hypothetical protein HY279_12975 [Nitrospinae bacterium]|nr:hypothetical protein [Nitrospinota bacterium]
MRKLFVIFFLCGALAACARNIPQIPALGEFYGQPIHTTVDSEIARYFLEHYLKGERIRPELDATIEAIARDIGNRMPTRYLLKSIAESHSTDLAALALWQSMLRDSGNRRAQSMFLHEFSRLKEHLRETPDRFTPDKSGYLIVFVPGWFYKSQPENGADFAKPRQSLTDAGVRTALLEIEENGTVEHNGDLIAKHLARLSRGEQKIIVVSASKAGPEVALALSELQRTNTNHNVKAWVNIGGVLRGSALADKALTWPTCWFVKLFVIKGASFDGIESMATLRSAERAERINLPSDILVMNYVGIPLSGQVSNRARLGYSLLRADGPNDGLTLIVDEIPAASVTIVELGLDHFFSDPEIHVKTVALANTVIRMIEANGAAPNNMFNADWQKRRFAPLFPAG